MTRLRFLPHPQICPKGKTIDVEPGTSICDAALNAGIL
ncbi:MAG: ISC system 2Fe-2S type ferredoxin, partial [Gammaproteobacteria bacterium]|nr:ISC system 2Fe-2S type ferredoxin [Gammaproteobacteria bacterium]